MVLGLGTDDALARRSHKLSVTTKVRRTRRVASDTSKLLDTDAEVMMCRLIRFDVHMRRRLPKIMTPYTGVGRESCVIV